MKISRLRLKNFKSFKKANIPFHEGFTAIAGSNASGKSNILDAMMFSLGITSLKMLRASKLTELVNHDATESQAKVEIDLTGKDRTYCISRTIDKQGKSIVRLDGKRKSLNEVNSLLRELGVKATGHNIVVQGDITRVIEMTALQRRNIIDEIAGLSEFEEKKEEAIKKLNSVDQRVKEAHIVLKERESYLEELEKERNSALEFNQLNKELKQSKATLLKEEIKRIKTELSGAKRKTDAMQKEIERKTKDKNTLSTEEKETEKKLSESTDKLLEASQKTFGVIGKEIEAKKSAKKISEERIKTKEEEIEKTKNRKLYLKEKIKELRKTIEEKNIEIQGQNKELKKIAKELEPIEGKHKTKSMELQKEKERLSAKENEIEKLHSEKDLLQHGLHEIEKETASLNKEILLAKERIKEIQEEKTRLGIEEKKNELKIIEEKLVTVEKQLLTIKKDIKKMQETSRGIRPELESVKDKLEKLIEAKETLLEQKIKIGEFIAEFFEETKEKELLDKILSKEKEKETLLAGKKETGQKMKKLALAKEKLGSELKKLKENLEKIQGITASEKFNELMKEKNLLQMNTKGNEVEIKQCTEREKEAKEEITEMAKEEKNAAQRIEEEKNIIKKIEKELNEKEAEMEKANKASSLLEEERKRLETKLKNINEKKEKLEQEIWRKEKEINEFNLSQSKNDVRIVDLEEEFKAFAGIKALEEFSYPALKQNISSIEKRIAELGAINMKALESFESYKTEVDSIRGKADKLEEERQKVLDLIDQIDVKKTKVFMDCFNKINANFNKLYYSFFNGEGRLGLTDPENPLESGLTIEAKYSEEKLKTIEAMSGGEKSLTALAFMFAIQSVEPAPFYIFDEADAALDKENSLKLGRLIQEISKDSQFISITHNDTVIKQADQLVGVALNKQKSSVIGLRLKQGIAENNNQASG